MAERSDVTLIKNAFDAAIAASMPEHVMATYLKNLTHLPTAILAIGKASGPMATACREAGLTAKGMLITHDHSVEVEGFDIHIGGHPVPDEGSHKAAEAAISFVSDLGRDDHLLVLMSGGGSALMALPAQGLTLADKMMVNETLLKSGLDIHQMNMVRRLLSGIKGGRLARYAAPVTVTQLVMSDVPATGKFDQDLSAIASGPFAGDPMSLDDAVTVLKDTGLYQHANIHQLVERIKADLKHGPVRIGDPILEAVETSVIASNEISRHAAIDALPNININLPDLEGEAMVMGARLAELMMDAGRPVTGVTGGETVVRFEDGVCSGKGGRSQELALSFLIAMSGYAEKGHDVPKFVLLAAGTDGRDGPTDAAGAIITDAMLAKGNVLKSWRDALSQHNSYPVLEACSALIKMPPTGTNLGDVLMMRSG